MDDTTTTTPAESAPYGLKADGTPKRKPGPAKGSPAPAAPRRKSAPRAAASKGGTDYRPGINGLFQAVCLPLSFAAPADAAAVSNYAPGIAEALNDLAKDRPEVAAMLERILQVGPYGMLIAAVVPLGVQLATNHDLIPEAVAVQMGATPKRKILAQLREQAERARRVPDQMNEAA
jgi:hypothetical protein